MIILAAHGSRHPRAQAAFADIEALVRGRFPGCGDPLWAFTSGSFRRHTGQPSPAQALERLAEGGVRRVAVQSLHVLAAGEFAGILAAEEACRGRFEALAVGGPLLATQADVPAVAAALAQLARPHLDAGKAVVVLGHGTAHPANAAYARLAQALETLDARLLLGLLEHGHGAADLARRVLALGCRRAVLTPLLFAAGQHAAADVDGAGPRSWRSVFSAHGLVVEAEPRGAAQHPALAGIWMDHLAAALARLDAGNMVDL